MSSLCLALNSVVEPLTSSAASQCRQRLNSIKLVISDSFVILEQRKTKQKGRIPGSRQRMQSTFWPTLGGFKVKEHVIGLVSLRRWTLISVSAVHHRGHLIRNLPSQSERKIYKARNFTRWWWWSLLYSAILRSRAELPLTCQSDIREHKAPHHHHLEQTHCALDQSRVLMEIPCFVVPMACQHLPMWAKDSESKKLQTAFDNIVQQ